MSKSPAFQFYVADFMSDPEADLLSPEELGGYLRLLMIAWQQPTPGVLPMDDKKLAKWSRLGRRWGACRGPILDCFKGDEPGVIYSRRMRAEREKQIAYREASSRGGKAGAAAKILKTAETASRVLEVPLPFTTSLACSEPVHSDLQSSVFSLQSLEHRSSLLRKEDDPAGSQGLLKIQDHPSPKDPAKVQQREDTIAVLQHYRAQWVAVIKPADGKPPTVPDADWGSLGRMVAAHGKTAMLAYVDRYLVDDHPAAVSNGYALRNLGTRINAYRMGRPPPDAGLRRNGPSAPRPPTVAEREAEFAAAEAKMRIDRTKGGGA